MDANEGILKRGTERIAKAQREERLARTDIARLTSQRDEAIRVRDVKWADARRAAAESARLKRELHVRTLAWEQLKEERTDLRAEIAMLRDAGRLKDGEG